MDVDLIRKEDLQELLAEEGSPCISVYLQTHRATAEVRQDSVKLRNAVREIRTKLADMKLSTADIDMLVEPLEAKVNDTNYWQHQSDALVVFRSATLFRMYRIPLQVQEAVIVGERFYVAPLVQILADVDQQYYVLCLSQKQVRLIRCSRFTAEEVPLPESVPKNLDEALQLDDTEMQLQFHTRAPGKHGKDRAGMHFGHADTDDHKQRIDEYCHRIDTGLRELLRDANKAPLILAGVEYLQPRYRAATTYQHLLEEGINGNPEGWKPEELQQKTWGIAEKHFGKALDIAKNRFEELAGTDRVSTALKEIVNAAMGGRVSFLIVGAGLQQWGRVEPEKQKVHMHKEQQDGDEELINIAAMQTLLHGGSVYTVPPDHVPQQAPAAAVFRY